MTPEQKTRVSIDALLTAAGWHVCDVANANIHAATGVAIREFPLNPGFGFADYLLYVNGKACGVIEAKKEGVPLKGVEVQSERYAQGLPAALPAWRRCKPRSSGPWARSRLRCTSLHSASACASSAASRCQSSI